MKKCISCGKTADSNNEISCRYCGGNLYQVETIRCANCGAYVKSDSKFCEHCGTDMNSHRSFSSPKHRIEKPVPEKIFIERKSSNKSPLVAITLIIVVCILAATTVCTALILDSVRDKAANEADNVVTSVSGEEKAQASDSKTTLTTEKKLNEDRLMKDEKEVNKEKQKMDENEDSETVSSKEESPDEKTDTVSDTSKNAHQTVYGLYDYDESSSDWYRLRKVKNDPSTQVGAYKTVEKALYYASIYVPQGYTLYDKDLNIVNVSDYVENVTSTETYEDTYYYGLYDYDQNNDDWYRLRKVKNDPTTQVGAYKTVEKALYYASIYVPQGYTLYDKDFNVIEY